MPDALFLAAVFVTSTLAGATAAVTGFGIGSLLTPLLALETSGVTAVAAVAFPHAVGTALRAWRLRRAVDREVLLRFGLLSAIGGLGGAMLFSRLGGPVLLRILGLLLLLTAWSVLSGWAAWVQPGRLASSVIGLLSGFFGGVAGNQGGLRAAALLSYRLTPTAFVATSTAVGLLVDAVRTPFYLWRAGEAIGSILPLVIVACAGVVVGTLGGERLLFGLSPERFRRIIAVLIGAIGAGLLLAS